MANPIVTPLGVLFSGTLRKKRKARYGKRDRPKNGPASASASAGVRFILSDAGEEGERFVRIVEADSIVDDDRDRRRWDVSIMWRLVL